MPQIKIGKVRKQLAEKRGWLVGQFMDEPEFKDEKVEIYYKTFPKGDIGDKLHYHPHGKEYMIVLGGKVKFRISDEVIILEEGDYIAIPNNIRDQILEVLEELTIMGVRYPSLPDNKVFIKE